MKLNAKEVLLTARPFWWITTAVPFVTGYLANQTDLSRALLAGAVYFLFPYNLFLYGVNDIFDYESDVRNPRKAGIEGAVLAKHKHRSLLMIILLLNIPFWLYFLAIGDVWSNGWLLLIIFMALAYSVKGLRFKEVPLLDSFTSAFHYTSPFLFGIFLARGTRLWLGAYLIFYIWAMCNHAFGAIQDIKPDREAGIASIATKLGAANVIKICLAGYSLAALLPITLFGMKGAVPALLLLVYVMLVARTFPYRDQADHPIFHKSWQRFTYLNYGIGAAMTIYIIFLATVRV